MNINLLNILKFLKSNKNINYVGCKVLNQNELSEFKNYIKNNKLNYTLDIYKISNNNFYVYIENFKKN